MSDAFGTPWTVTCQAPLSIRFPRQEYCSGLPFPSPGDLPDPGIEPTSPALAGALFTAEAPGKPQNYFQLIQKQTVEWTWSYKLCFAFGAQCSWQCRKKAYHLGDPDTPMAS